MKLLLTSLILPLLLTSVSHAQSAGWKTNLTCTGPGLKIQITLPPVTTTGGIVLGGSLVMNGAGAGIPAMITRIDSQTLDFMRQDGFSCALGKAQSISGSCGYVATGKETAVSCN
jgi:hypothetical protein